MNDPCIELTEMLAHIPTYTSWAAVDLEKIFLRYSEIITEMMESRGYKDYKWLAAYCPDLKKRIQEMLLEQHTDRQSRHFNNIAFELLCAIEVLTGKLKCKSPDKWKVIMANRPQAA